MTMVYTIRKKKKNELRAYIDVDWARNIDHRKSTRGGTFLLGKRLVTWTSKNKIAYLNLLSKLNIWLLQ